MAGPFDDPMKYRLLRLVASGGEGELWCGSVDASGRAVPVAIKVLHKQRSAQAFGAWQRRWTEQVELLRSLDHEHVVTIRESFVGSAPFAGESAKVDTALYLVMNWVSGVTLAEWCRADGRSFVQIKAALDQIASALDYLHGRPVHGLDEPVVHRDVKPGNVLVSGSGVAVLVDFGLTRFAFDAEMTVAGTEGYWAPESRSPRGEYSPASDRFAFGCTTYAVICGSRPAISDRRAMERELQRGLRAVGAPEVAAETFFAMLDDNPRDRPSSCAGWMADVFEAPLRRRLGTSTVEDIARSEVVGTDIPSFRGAPVAPDPVEPIPCVPPAPGGVGAAARSYADLVAGYPTGRAPARPQIRPIGRRRRSGRLTLASSVLWAAGLGAVLRYRPNYGSPRHRMVFPVIEALVRGRPLTAGALDNPNLYLEVTRPALVHFTALVASELLLIGGLLSISMVRRHGNVIRLLRAATVVLILAALATAAHVSQGRERRMVRQVVALSRDPTLPPSRVSWRQVYAALDVRLTPNASLEQDPVTGHYRDLYWIAETSTVVYVGTPAWTSWDYVARHIQEDSQTARYFAVYAIPADAQEMQLRGWLPAAIDSTAVFDESVLKVSLVGPAGNVYCDFSLPAPQSVPRTSCDTRTTPPAG